MPDPAPVVDAVNASGFLLVLSLVVPVAGVLLAFVTGGRHAERIALLATPLGLAIAVAIVASLLRTGGPLVYFLGGFAPPLGVALRADGLAGIMLVITAIVVCAVAVFARGDLRTPAGTDEAREPFAFWILLLGVWGALDMVFLAGDLFALYVALELLTFAAVPMVCLDGRAETIAAALRYLLFTLPGSILYLLGTLLLYGATGTLDNELLSQRLQAEPATLIGAAIMTVGLLAKTALFPLQLWLPPAHAGARPAASAVLSALVVKGPWFIVIRLWFDVLPGLPGPAGAQLLGALGAAAIVFSSVLALRQVRLKLVIAYSTLAQIGSLFLVFPLAFHAGSAELQAGGALAGGTLQAVSHATAKAAMFMAAGLLYTALGHDRIAGLGGSARALPVPVLAFALGGVALIGLPPSGAYLAKDLLLQAAGETQQWWWTLVIQSGGFLTSSYLVLVLAHALAPAGEPIHLRARVARGRELAVLALALCSLLLGLAPWGALLPVPAGGAPALFSLDALWKGLGPVAGGAVIAVLLGRWGDRPLGAALGATVARLAPARRGAVAFGSVFERVDEVLRQWPAAGLAMLALTIALGAAMLAGR